MNGFLKQSTASQVRTIGPFVDDTDFKTLETALTIANTDIKLKKNGGTAASKNSGGATADSTTGLYHLTWDATDTATVGELSVSVKVSGALVYFCTYTVLEEAVYDMLFGASATGFISDTTRASQASVDAIDDYVDTEVGAIKVVTDKLDTTMEADGAVYRFTSNTLEQSPTYDASGRIFYLDATTNSDISGYKKLLPSPSLNPESTVVIACTGTSDVVGEEFATDAGVPNVINFPPGTSYRRIFAKVSGGVAKIHFTAYVRDAGGVETLVRDELTSDISNTATAPVQWSATTSIGSPMLPTDRIVVKLLARRVSGPTTVTVTIYAEGSANASHIQTTLPGATTDPWATSIPSSYASGTAGNILGNRLDVAVSSRASQTSLDTLDDYVDTEVAAIKVKTDQLVFTGGTVNANAELVFTSGDLNAMADALLKRDWNSVTGEAAYSALNAFRMLRNVWNTTGGTLSVKKEDGTTNAWTRTLTVDPTAQPIVGAS